MALTIGSGGGVGILYGNTTKTPFTSLPHRPVHPQFTIPLSGRTLHIVSAKKFSPRTGRLDNKNRRGGITTKEQEVEQRTAEIEDGNNIENVVLVDGAGEGYMLPELPGDKPDFWEGSKWDAFGFFVQYLWAFGIVFALIACGIAVATYNEGATDFKETPAYRESIQSQELLEEPEASNSDVFESNPTEVAPSLD
ncbi:AT-rich interactive domain protein [Quillaja saponaria]|uniref:AT-rich interactive domain protein n=1 Tax=Quillaja saponaria TaxID=32244 RepID=A0AAD7M492_QUISA|nr:AT-rich interactive domain protein [Quillaja saponaria]